MFTFNPKSNSPLLNRPSSMSWMDTASAAFKRLFRLSDEEAFESADSGRERAPVEPGCEGDVAGDVRAERWDADERETSL